MNTKTTTKRRATKITSLFLALIMALSMLGGLNLTAFAQEKLIGNYSGTLNTANLAKNYTINVEWPRDYSKVFAIDFESSNHTLKVTVDGGTTTGETEFVAKKDTLIHYSAPDEAYVYVRVEPYFNSIQEMNKFTSCDFTLRIYDITPTTDITNVQRNGDSLRLEWNNADVSKYVIFGSYDSAFNNINDRFETTGTYFTINGIPKDTTYYFQIVPVIVINEDVYYMPATDVYYSAPATNSKPAAPKATSITKLTKGKKSFKVSWKKVSGVTGYQIQYCTKKSMKGAKIKTVKKASAAKATVKKLKANKKYYVRVRTYKVVDGKKVYSKWSAKKTVKTK